MRKEGIWLRKGSVSVIAALAGIGAGAAAVGRIEAGRRKKEERTSGKFMAMFYMMNRWVRVKQEGKNLSAYFEEKGYHRIAIYGLSYVGETLLAELKGTGIEVAYGIDRKVCSARTDISVISPADRLECVDAIVVTAIDYMEEIRQSLGWKVECPILSIEDVIFDV